MALLPYPSFFDGLYYSGRQFALDKKGKWRADLTNLLAACHLHHEVISDMTAENVMLHCVIQLSMEHLNEQIIILSSVQRVRPAVVVG